MSRTLLFVSIPLVVIVFKLYQIFNYHPEIPEIGETWWSDADPSKEDKKIYPFKINVSEEILDDLKYRLAHTRPLPKPLVDNQEYGLNGDLAQEILNYWRTKYDWRMRERRMNELPHFITSIQGLKIHFIHVKPQNISSKTKVLPILLAHGWPSSFIEFLDIIKILTTPQKDRDFVFEAVFVTTPGFGFSEAPQKPGFGAQEGAVVFKNLMNRLGLQQFYIHSGDMGHFISKFIPKMYPGSVLGFHTNMCLSLHPYSLFKYLVGLLYPRWIEREDTRKLIYPLGNLIHLLWTEFGYLHVQSTKPDTFGIAIDDSPMGMAAAYLEKFSTGANVLQNRQTRDGRLGETYNIDDLLDNVMIYWVSKSGTTSYRFYSEVFGSRAPAALWLPVEIPTACLRGAIDITSPKGISEEVFPNEVHSDEHNLGHFMGFENPEVVASKIFDGIESIERIYTRKQCTEDDSYTDL